MDDREVFEQAVARDPANVALWGNRAVALARAGKTEDALAIYQRALAVHPTQRDLLYNRGNLLHRAGAWGASEESFRRLLSFYPNDGAAWLNLGMTLKALARWDEAEVCCQRAVTLADPALRAQATYNYANLLLARGKWRAGVVAFEARLALPNALGAPWGLPAWHADLPQGSRILVWNDQGLGDGLMFLRFAPLLAAKGYQLFAFAQEPLKKLAATVRGIEGVFGPEDEPVAMDAALPMGSLPYVLGLEDAGVWDGPYVKSTTHFPEKVVGRRNIGIVWAGNPAHSNDANRSMRFEDLAPLFDVPDIAWFSLQFGKTVLDSRVADLAPRLVDLAATAVGFGDLGRYRARAFGGGVGAACVDATSRDKRRLAVGNGRRKKHLLSQHAAVSSDAGRTLGGCCRAGEA